MTVIQLKEELRKRGLLLGGNKAALVDRLRANVEEEDAEVLGLLVGEEQEEEDEDEETEEEEAEEAEEVNEVFDEELDQLESKMAELSTLTAAELRQRLDDRSVSSQGKKAALLERLRDSMRSEVSVAAAAARNNKATTAPFPEPNVQPFLGTPPTQWLRGEVKCVLTFGTFVEVAAPRDGTMQWGVVPSAVLDRWTSLGRDAPNAGDEVLVRATHIDIPSNKLGLSLLEEEEEEQHEQEEEDELDDALGIDDDDEDMG